MKESELGLEVFLSEGIPGIGGKLRKAPEDFVVDEISILPPSFPDGNIVIAKVWHLNWEQNRLVRTQWQEMLTDPEQKIARPRQVWIGHETREIVPIEKRGK